MKIIFIHPPWDNGPSGGHGYNRQLVAEARRRGFPLESRPFAPGAPITSVNGPPGGIVLWDSLFLIDLAEQPPGNPSAVHGLLAHYLPFTNPLLTAEQRLTWTRHFDAAMERAGFLIATGAGAARLLERRYPGKPVYLCEPGIDTAFMAARGTAPAATSGRPVHIATVANLLSAKGHGGILAALAEIDPRDWEWHIVGDERPEPAYAAAFWAETGVMGLAGNIVRHGVLDVAGLAELLGQMDIFAYASRFEAYGMALAEAAAVGLPIVTTAVGEAGRIVQDGETGYVVALDAPERFRDELARLITDGELRRRSRAGALARPVRGWDAAWEDFERCVRAIPA